MVNAATNERADRRPRPPRGHGQDLDDDRKPSWAGILSLCLGIFAIVMSEFLPASLLLRISADLRVSVGAAGQAVSVTALSAAVSALFIAAVLPRADRRRVTLGLTLLAAVSDVLVAAAPDLLAVLAARVLLGVALGGFWVMATAMAAQLVPPDHVGRALTVVNAGVSAATVAAVPLGAWLGGVWGWRPVFVLGAGAAAAALVVQASSLPSVTPAAVGGLRAVAAVMRSGTVLVGLGAVLLVFSGHFGGFTYLRPAVGDLMAIGNTGFAAVLVVLGLAGFVGTAVSGPVADRAPRVGVLAFPALVGLGMLLAGLLGGTTVGLYAAVTVWGLGFGGVPTTVMSWGARTQPSRLEQIGGVVVTVCSVGITIGAVAGGVLVDVVSPVAPLLAGGAAALAGALVLSAARTRG